MKKSVLGFKPVMIKIFSGETLIAFYSVFMWGSQVDIVFDILDDAERDKVSVVSEFVC